MGAQGKVKGESPLVRRGLRGVNSNPIEVKLCKVWLGKLSIFGLRCGVSKIKQHKMDFGGGEGSDTSDTRRQISCCGC